MLVVDAQQSLDIDLATAQLRCDLAREPRHDRVLAPLRAGGQRRHRRARFLALAHALERLVVAILQQCVVTGGLRRIVEQVAAEDADQARLGHERCKREEHEVALRADAAPAVHRPLAEQVEVAVATREMRVVVVGLRELARDRELAQRSQQRVVVEVGRDMAAQVGRERAFERPALGPLVVHLAGALDQAAVAGRTLVGEHHLVDAQHHRGERHDRGVHRGHRDMPVPGALAVVLEQLRRQLAADVERRQAGAFGAGLDQLRTADPGHRLLDAERTQRLDADQRILAAADRNQRVMAQTECACRRAGGRRRRKADATMQVQAVAIREFAQAVQVDVFQQACGRVVDGIRLDADLGRHRGLVVAHACHEMQQAQGALCRLRARAVECEWRTGQGHRLDQLRAMVERIDQLRDAAAGIEAAAHEAERADGVAIEVHRTHSSTSSRGKARRL